MKNFVYREFNYSKHGEELMRIVKIVLKESPKSGEEISIKYLSVTYTLESWERREHMVALSKFNDTKPNLKPHDFASRLMIQVLKEEMNQETSHHVTNRIISDEEISMLTLPSIPNNRQENHVNNDIEDEPKKRRSIDLDSRNLKKLKSMMDSNILVDNNKTPNLTPEKKLRHRTESKENEYVNDQDSANPKTSDITDILKTGHMVWLSKGKVVEQTTKAEIDEVLENSEEVETTEGESRLVSSSLRSLERMVTCIKEPPPTEDETNSALQMNEDFSLNEDCESEDDIELRLEDEDDPLDNSFSEFVRMSPKITSNVLITDADIHPDIVRSIQMKNLIKNPEEGKLEDDIVINTDENSNNEIKQVKKSKNKSNKPVARDMSLRSSLRPRSLRSLKNEKKVVEKLPKNSVKKSIRKSTSSHIKDKKTSLKSWELLRELCSEVWVVIERLDLKSIAQQ